MASVNQPSFIPILLFWTWLVSPYTHFGVCVKSCFHESHMAYAYSAMVALRHALAMLYAIYHAENGVHYLGRHLSWRLEMLWDSTACAHPWRHLSCMLVTPLAMHAWDATSLACLHARFPHGMHAWDATCSVAMHARDATCLAPTKCKPLRLHCHALHLKHAKRISTEGSRTYPSIKAIFFFFFGFRYLAHGCTGRIRNNISLIITRSRQAK